MLALLAVSTLRMKCFWGPYICVFAGAALAHYDLWNLVVSKLGGAGAATSDRRLLVNFVRHLVLFAALGTMYAASSAEVYSELENLR